MITKYGINTFVILASISLVIIIASFFINNNYIKFTLLIVGILFLLFNINFFRDPERNTPAQENIIVSSADGKIISIREVFEKRFLNDNAIQVSIFMSPLDVHVNRIPISGTIDYLNYVKGNYLVAFHDKADLRNERTEIGITSKYGKVLFTQIAGYIARRIVFNIRPGDTVKAGERFGMIKFGSRSDIIVPKKWILKVKVGDRVKAGETIIFEYPNE
ncbi:phosphatidylserine decarboxylase family protein [Rosettibacter firmus]|uniref:phosphatidylserine decarboxylase family protein n=1 Tax=Rosettibacter firmus TaxID=3111522 RepID=UPI00336C117B